jgi:esterase/lipase
MEHPRAGAFELGPSAGPRVLLFHGLTGAPSELWPLGRALATAGFRAVAPLWPGHGETAASLVSVDAGDLLSKAQRLADVERPAAIVGLSMGSLLATVAAAGAPTVERLVLCAPAVRMAGRSRLFDRLGGVPWPHGFPLLVPKGAPETGGMLVPCGEHSMPVRVAEASVARPGEDGRYAEVPLRWSRELRKVREAALAAARQVRAPALLLHGGLDRTADPAGSLDLARRLRGPSRIVLLPGSPHVLTLGPDRGRVAAEAVRFLAPLVEGRRAAG